jgi:hypothetical protein
MPEAITIVEEQTPALSPENQEMLQALEQAPATDEGQLLAGKYKSVQELEKAYKELQSKLGQGTKPAPAAAEADADEQAEAEESDEVAEPAAGNAREIYGDFIGSRLEESNIDFSSMADRWSQSGTLDDGDYSQLEEAGFTRDMVDAYLSGLNYKAAQDSQLTTKEITSIKEQYGGEAQYSAMIEWASQNLEKEEIDAFNQVVNTQPLNVAKLAIAGLHAKFTAAEGREPRLIGGKAPKSTGEKFESTAQLVAAMSDPRYQSDPAYRNKVEDKLRRSAIM